MLETWLLLIFDVCLVISYCLEGKFLLKKKKRSESDQHLISVGVMAVCWAIDTGMMIEQAFSKERTEVSIIYLAFVGILLVTRIPTIIEYLKPNKKDE